ncbi:MAG: DUF6362 family protein [Thalassobaculaceae bacterium]|nr:DUF6362 family protein [Thalassobaculaceae bacterium]
MVDSLSAAPRKPGRSPTPDPVADLLREAAETLRRLPRGLARPRLSNWPEVVRDSASFLAAPDGIGRRPSPPSPQAIDRMDRTLVWLLACDDESRRLVWARATGIPWRKLEDMDGRSHVTLRKIVARGHDQIRVQMAAGDMKNTKNKKKPLYAISKTA